MDEFDLKKRPAPFSGGAAGKRCRRLDRTAAEASARLLCRTIRGLFRTVATAFRPSGRRRASQPARVPARLWASVPAAAALMLAVAVSLSPAIAEEGPSLQALVVTTADWPSVDASLRLYERRDTRSAWVPAGEAIPAVVGRNGLAWGRGARADLPAGGPQKREGDGRAPAGIFRLGPAFGQAPGESVPWIALPYRQMGEASQCVDDPASPAYNRLVDRRSAADGWSSAEDMLRSDGQYRLGIVIGHNVDPVLPGYGSCIFLHIWDRPSRGTSGCTAVSEAGMEEVLRRLKPEANPILVQLPGPEYERLRGPWGLP